MPSPATAPRPEFVQAVEFPYYLYPRAHWERELVWLKNIGIRTIEFSIPWNWHQLDSGDFDFTGRTSPRRDLEGFVHILKRLELHAWVRPLPPVPGWLNDGVPRGAGAEARRVWLRRLDALLGPQAASHGGPILYVEGRGLTIAPEPPAPIVRLSALDSGALARSRETIATGAGSLLWVGVEDQLYPPGWSADPTVPLLKGAVRLSGDEQPAVAALRRDAALLRNWTPLLATVTRAALPKPPGGKLPHGLSMIEVTSPAASAVSVTNRGAQPFQGDLRVAAPANRHATTIPGVTVPPGESLWLPLDVSIRPDALCHACTNFAGAEHIIYATAELLDIEFENGILAMEFAAPQEGEVVLQLARKPVGPYLAKGRLTEFDWDDKALRARLKIPAGEDLDHHVRVGIAIEEPDTSAFFDEAHRLIIGQTNPVATEYSSPEVAARSRLRLPPGFTATPVPTSPNQIEYDVNVPATALHGDWADLAIEADGMPMGRAHVQLLRPVSIRPMDAMNLHFGSHTELTPDPPIIPIDPKTGTDVEISIRNNAPRIETYRLAASGDGLEFFPAKSEIVVGAVAERRFSFRVFGREGASGLLDGHLHLAASEAGGATLDLPMRILLLPRGQTVAWSADLDGGGSREWVLESQKVRAVFSSQDGGRWIELCWKDGNVNFLPEAGVFAATGPVNIRASRDSLEFRGKNWKRTVRLTDDALTIEQTTPLPSDGLKNGVRGDVSLGVAHPSAQRALYTLTPGRK